MLKPPQKNRYNIFLTKKKILNNFLDFMIEEETRQNNQKKNTPTPVSGSLKK
jgi:hypothetical protein